MKRKDGRAVWSGNSNYKVFNGGQSTSDIVSGKYGRGLEFDGSYNYVDLPVSVINQNYGSWEA